MFSEATSGLKVAAGRTRSSAVIVGAPPVVMFTTTLERCLITLRNGAKASGVWSGRPSCGLRACRCTIAAPASAAPMALSAISWAVTGRCGDIDGVWIDPVTAQVIMTLRDFAMSFPSRPSECCRLQMDFAGDPRVSAVRKSPRVATDDHNRARNNTQADDDHRHRLRHAGSAGVGRRFRRGKTRHPGGILSGRSRVSPLLLVRTSDTTVCYTRRPARPRRRRLGPRICDERPVRATAINARVQRLHSCPAWPRHYDPARLRSVVGVGPRLT